MLMNSIVLDPPYSLMYYLCIFPYGTALYTDNKSPMLLGTVHRSFKYINKINT